MGEEKVRLTDEDWNLLLPYNPVELGKTVLNVKPLGIEKLSEVIGKIKTMAIELSGLGITQENYDQPENLIILIEALCDKAPEVISEASGLHIEDLKRLTPILIVPIIEKAIDINIKSQKGLVKNFEALAGKIVELIEGKPEENQPVENSGN